VNDDGIEAPGLKALIGELWNQHKYDLFVVAPEVEQSAMSHAISVHGNISAERHRYTGYDFAGVTAWKVRGTPADCVKLAFSQLLPGPLPHRSVSLVLSGINRGNNSGVNVLYSGTVGAAVEGTLQGVKSAALSLDHPIHYPSPSDTWPFSLAAEVSLPLVDHMLSHSLPSGVTLNINIPNVKSRKEIKGVRLTHQGLSGFQERYEQVEHIKEQTTEREKYVYRLKGRIAVRDNDDSFDTLAIRSGFISITPLSIFNDLRRESAHSHAEDIGKWSIFRSNGTAKL